MGVFTGAVASYFFSLWTVVRLKERGPPKMHVVFLSGRPHPSTNHYTDFILSICPL